MPTPPVSTYAHNNRFAARVPWATTEKSAIATAANVASSAASAKVKVGRIQAARSIIS